MGQAERHVSRRGKAWPGHVPGDPESQSLQVLGSITPDLTWPWYPQPGSCWGPAFNTPNTTGSVMISSSLWPFRGAEVKCQPAGIWGLGEVLWGPLVEAGKHLVGAACHGQPVWGEGPQTQPAVGRGPIHTQNNGDGALGSTSTEKLGRVNFGKLPGPCSVCLVPSGQRVHTTP